MSSTPFDIAATIFVLCGCSTLILVMGGGIDTYMNNYNRRCLVIDIRLANTSCGKPYPDGSVCTESYLEVMYEYPSGNTNYSRTEALYTGVDINNVVFATYNTYHVGDEIQCYVNPGKFISLQKRIYESPYGKYAIFMMILTFVSIGCMIMVPNLSRDEKRVAKNVV